MKKLISFVLVLTLMVPICSSMAFAARPVTYSDPENFSFALNTGAASSHSNVAYKNDTVQADVMDQYSTNISSKNQVAYRIRRADNNNTSVSSLYVKDSTENFSIYYYNNEAKKGNYRLWANAPSTNKEKSVSISGKFYP